MSSLQCANIIFESTSNNRVQYGGSNNFVFVAAGANVFSINSSALKYSPSGSDVMTVNTSVVTYSIPVSSANISVQTVTNNTYTLTNADSGTTITFNNTTVTTVTIPTGLPIGFRCYCLMLGTGNVTFTNAASVTQVTPSSNTISTRYSSGTVFSYAANAVIVTA